MFIAKDKNGAIKLFERKPHRIGDYWVVTKPIIKWMQLDVPVSIQIEWEDEPVEVEIISKSELTEVEKLKKELEVANNWIEFYQQSLNR